MAVCFSLAYILAVGADWAVRDGWALWTAGGAAEAWAFQWAGVKAFSRFAP